MKLSDLQINLTEKIGKGALLTATDKDGNINTMTVSWGTFGVLWGKEVVFLFVRPERYTFAFTESGSKMSLSFFDALKKDTLTYCGTKSGRDVDKFKECMLGHKMVDGVCVFDDAKYTLSLEKLYADTIKEECFIEMAPLDFYKNGGLHKMYVCSVTDIICK